MARLADLAERGDEPLGASFSNSNSRNPTMTKSRQPLMVIDNHQADLALYRTAVAQVNQTIAASRELIAQSIALLRIAEAVASARIRQPGDQIASNLNSAPWEISSYTECLRERAARLFGLALRATENGLPNRVAELAKLAHELIARVEAMDSIAAR